MKSSSAGASTWNMRSMRSRLLSAMSIVLRDGVVFELVRFEVCRVLLGEALVDIALDVLADGCLNQFAKALAASLEEGVEVVGTQKFSGHEVCSEQLIEAWRVELGARLDDGQVRRW